MSYLKVDFASVSKNLIHFIQIIQITFVGLFFSTSLSAQGFEDSTKDYLIIDDSTYAFPLDSYLHYYNDEEGNLSIYDITNDRLQSQFSDSLHITKKTKYIWAYFDVKTKSNREWLLDAKTKNSSLYIKRNNKWVIYKPSNYLYSDEHIAAHVSNLDYVERIYIKVVPYSIMKNGNSNMFIKQRVVYERRFIDDTVFYMLVVGIVFGLFFYNLFLAISTKSYSYYFYSISIFVAGLKLLLFSMLFKEFFVEIDYVSLFSDILTPLSIIFYALFSLAYFKEDYKSKWTKVIVLLLLIHIVASILYTYNTFYNSDPSYASLGNLSIISVYTSFLVYSIYKAKKKVLGSRWFLLANSFLIPTVLVAVISNMFVASINLGYILGFGVVIQLLLFSFALGSRFNSIKKQITQKELEKEQLEKNQILEVQQLVEQKNIELVEQVTNRTAKLQETNEEMSKLIEELDTTNDSLQSTFAELQVQHKKVTDSIYYANNIQEAILPNISRIEEVFSDLFVFFRPRDVVSGDFYWYMPLENDKYLVGAFDCTGHGVPGAFMSLISSQILNEIVLVKKKIMPNEILDSLRKQIYFLLKQNENRNKDGLDACLILIDKKEELIYFSGAKNPLYYVKNNILETIKGDNLYIGGEYNEIDKFMLHTIPFYQKDTQFYLSSDGIQDQFGGEKGRKLLRKVFKEYLLKSSDLSAENQHTFWSTFVTEWQKENKQTDDMLLIGVRP